MPSPVVGSLTVAGPAAAPHAADLAGPVAERVERDAELHAVGLEVPDPSRDA